MTRTPEKMSKRAYESLLEGYTSVGSDEYTSEFWTLGQRRQLVVEGLWLDDNDPKQWRQALRLPNGDIMEILCGLSWTRWTKNGRIIRERMARKSITGYRYSEVLATALTRLNDKGLLRQGMYFSWFGIQPTSKVFVESHVQGAYAAFNNLFADEKIECLREWLRDCVPEHPEHKDDLLDAMLLLTGDCIEVVADEG